MIRATSLRGQVEEWSSLGSMLNPEPWMQEGLCAQTDPEMFFPEKGGTTRNAKKVCASCDVVKECLAYAMRGEERFGIWGGLSERERRKLRRQDVPKSGGATRTKREERVLRQMVAADSTNVDIAERLGITAATVANWRKDLGLPAARQGRRPKGAVA